MELRGLLWCICHFYPCFFTLSLYRNNVTNYKITKKQKMQETNFLVQKVYLCSPIVLSMSACQPKAKKVTKKFVLCGRIFEYRPLSTSKSNIRWIHLELYLFGDPSLKAVEHVLRDKFGNPLRATKCFPSKRPNFKNLRTVNPSNNHQDVPAIVQTVVHKSSNILLYHYFHPCAHSALGYCLLPYSILYCVQKRQNAPQKCKKPPKTQKKKQK
ncbi:hypothetical protein L3Y34_012558 [Caenorhabditis briggsae]|uniref:Uncharacterized protein n=1 Tax=Caenorhabditis briggsae TaxID=6238 RepID=A0AAE8ZRN0_CAEBR|nr:hypothetical protein L3Y34_012558 [Caenorhabditis briggsae]